MYFPSESDMMSKELQNSDLLHVNLIAFMLFAAMILLYCRADLTDLKQIFSIFGQL